MLDKSAYFDPSAVCDHIPPMPRSPDVHIDDEALSLYAMNRIKDEDHLASIEEHLLVCHTCQYRLRFEDALIAGLRAATEEVLWSRTHATEDGEVNAYVYRGPRGTLHRTHRRRSTRLRRMACIGR
jgi:hypothetical protein